MSIHSTFCRFAGPLDEAPLVREPLELEEPGFGAAAVAGLGPPDWEPLSEVEGLLAGLLGDAAAAGFLTGGAILKNLVKKM